MASSYKLIGLTLFIAILAKVFDLAILTVPVMVAFIAIAIAFWQKRKRGLSLLYTIGGTLLVAELIWRVYLKE